MSDKRIPAIGEYVRGVGTLVAVQDAPPPMPPPPPDKEYIFEEVTSHFEVVLGDAVLKEFSTTWDYYGKETSVISSIEHAKAYATAHKIGPDSELEIVAIKTVTHVRKFLKANTDNLYDKAFYQFEPLKHNCLRDIPPPVSTVVWSSKTGDAK